MFRKIIVILSFFFFALPVFASETINVNGQICSCTCQETNTNINTNTNQPVVYSDEIIINEIFPNPEGDDALAEFIELKNIGELDVDLADWEIADASRSYVLGENIIEAGGYFVVSRADSNIALNNTGEEKVYLFQPDGNLLQEVDYTGSEEGRSFSFFSPDWRWTDSTPGAENVLVEETNTNLNTNLNQNENLNSNQNSNQNANLNLNTNVNENANQNTNQPVVYSSQVVINEIFPDPVGDDSQNEFLELKNAGSQDIDLTGWQISDATDKNYALSGIIKAGDFMTIYRKDSGVSFNNTSDKAELFWPDSTLLESVDYSGSKEGFSYARFENVWQWSDTPTPAAENELKKQAASEEESEIAGEEGATLVTTILSAKDSEKNTAVKLLGQAVVEPGIFSAQYFYLADEEAGIKIYSSKKEFPKIKPGDILEVLGKVSVTKEGVKINKEEIKILKNEELEPLELPIEEFSQDLDGKLVKIAGEVKEKSSSRLVIEDENGEKAEVVFKKTAKLNPSDYQIKNNLEVVGVLVGEEVWPRDKDDIKKIKSETAAESFSIASAGQSKQVLYGLAFMGGAILIALGVVGAKYYRKKLATK